uniref:Uncharacterized protein n=1 Tax=Rhizophagus irregularis (strain DAOM 181602 / DAOM 197198 / MUCL 43194) TaxID=747089 RepID=U9UFS8_RHIID
MTCNKLSLVLLLLSKNSFALLFLFVLNPFLDYSNCIEGGFKASVCEKFLSVFVSYLIFVDVICGCFLLFSFSYFVESEFSDKATEDSEDSETDKSCFLNISEV